VGGLLVGDGIVAVGGNPVQAPQDLTWSGELDGNMLVLGIVRDGSCRNLTVALDLPPRSLRIGP
jgi:hypothetical protein